MERILVLSAHTDDAELGAGGFIRKLFLGHTVIEHYAFTTCESSHVHYSRRDYQLRQEFSQACRVLGIAGKVLDGFMARKFPQQRQQILDELVQIGLRLNPDTILVPATSDVHQDHQVITMEAKRAFKKCTILGYELPWNSYSFKPGLYVNIPLSLLQTKINAIMKYISQVDEYEYFKPAKISALATMRGYQIGTSFAEAFEVIRWVL